MPFSKSWVKHFAGLSLLSAVFLTTYAAYAEPPRLQCQPKGEGMQALRPPLPMPEGMLPPFLRGIELSDQQEDKIFELLHQQAPAMRTAAKTMKAARHELRDLAQAQTFNSAAAKLAADKVGQAEAAMVFLRVQTDVQLLALLTPAQREELKKRPQPEGPLLSRDFLRGEMPPPPM